MSCMYVWSALLRAMSIRTRGVMMDLSSVVVVACSDPSEEGSERSGHTQGTRRGVPR